MAAVDRTRSPLPKTRRGQERRRLILDSAMQVFAVQGSTRVSLTSLAAMLGMTQQGLMHYFPTKAELVISVLERRDEIDEQHRRSLAESGLTFPELLVQRMRHHDAHREQAALHAVLMAECVAPEHPAHAWFAERNKRARTGLTAAIAAAQSRGEMLPDLDPEPVAARILALFDGLALQRALGDPGVRSAAVFEHYMRTLTPPA